MRVISRRQSLLLAGFAVCAPALLTRARACEFSGPSLRVVHPWTRSARVEDRHAIVCMTVDEVSASDRLVAVESPVAERAEMGGERAGDPVDVPIPVGAATVLSEAGTHLRLVGLKEPLAFGRVYPLRLVFEKAGAMDVDLTVDFA